MWSNAEGGGFNTSFGGPDGGYGNEFSSQGTPEVRKNQSRIENVLPLTARTILELDEDTQTYLGRPVYMVELVGLITSVDVTSTKFTYILDDSTATIPVIKWIDTENMQDEETLMENTYCRVHGTFKTHQGNKQILALHLEAITDFNWVTAHILEVIHTSLILSQMSNKLESGNMGNKASDSMSQSMVGIGGLGGGIGGGFSGGGGSFSGGGTSGSFPGMQGLSNQQNMVFQVIRSGCDSNDSSGFNRDDIKGRLKGKMTSQQVDEVLFFLSSEGHIYTTMDEDHFKATDG